VEPPSGAAAATPLAQRGAIWGAVAVYRVDSIAAPFGETAEWRANGVAHVGAAGLADVVRDARRRAAPAFDVRELGWTNAQTDLQAAQERGQPVYVAITDYYSTGYWNADTLRAWGNINRSRAEAHRQYLQDLFDRTEPIRVYRPRDLGALGPTVTLLRLKPSQ